MKKWLQSNLNNIIVGSFLIPILLVAFVSISHVTTFYSMANPLSWAIYLSVAVEIAALAALAGILIGPLISVMPEMGGDILIKAFAAMTLGGFGSIAGALIGGILMGIIENLAAFYISTTLREISAFFIIIVILLIKPTGIMGSLHEIAGICVHL
jgi:branched-subunit amino acid ABC-type transport system permease component